MVQFRGMVPLHEWQCDTCNLEVRKYNGEAVPMSRCVQQVAANGSTGYRCGLSPFVGNWMYLVVIPSGKTEEVVINPDRLNKCPEVLRHYSHDERIY